MSVLAVERVCKRLEVLFVDAVGRRVIFSVRKLPMIPSCFFAQVFTIGAFIVKAVLATAHVTPQND